MTNYELNSPFLDLEFTADLSYKVFMGILILWVTFWLVIVAGIVYLYAFILPNYWGFEATVLVGIALIALSASS